MTTPVHVQYPWVTKSLPQSMDVKSAVLDKVHNRLNLDLTDYMKLRELANEALEVVTKPHAVMQIVTPTMPSHESWYAHGEHGSISIDTESQMNILRSPDAQTPNGAKAEWHSGGLFDSFHEVGMTLLLGKRGGWLLCHCNKGVYRWQIDRLDDLRRGGMRQLRYIVSRGPKQKASTIDGKMERVGIEQIKRLIGPAPT